MLLLLYYFSLSIIHFFSFQLLLNLIQIFQCGTHKLEQNTPYVPYYDKHLYKKSAIIVSYIKLKGLTEYASKYLARSGQYMTINVNYFFDKYCQIIFGQQSTKIKVYPKSVFLKKGLHNRSN